MERDACGPPSDEKLQALAEALGEPHAENLFAKADRVTPRVVNIILQHPTEWSELLEAAKDLRADHIENLKGTILVIPGNHDVATAFSPGTAIDAVVTPRKGKNSPFRGVNRRSQFGHS